MQEKSKRQLKIEQKIKEENIQRFEEVVNLKKEISEEYKLKIKKALTRNIIVGLFFVIYMLFLNISFWYIETFVYISIIIISSIIIGLSSIIFFELGYRKDNEYIFLNGVEMFIVGFLSMSYIYVYQLFFHIYSNILTMLTVVIFLYFVLKLLIVNIKMKNKYFKEQNDIKNII